MGKKGLVWLGVRPFRDSPFLLVSLGSGLARLPVDETFLGGGEKKNRPGEPRQGGGASEFESTK